jgi:DNA-binding response OmpR family regulator
MRILVVEDDERIASFLDRGLSERGYQVTVASSGHDGVELAMDPEIELVILDLSLPGLDGHEVLARLRDARRGPPVLVLTARDALDQKVRALDGGADDYMTKPFALDELLARVRALSRRSDQRSADAIELGPVRLDLLARRATRDDRVVDLSTREFALLEYLMRHPDQVLTRSQILSAVWEYDFDPQSNIVDVYVRYLRNKIDSLGGPSHIETIRGTGYRFRALADGAPHPLDEVGVDEGLRHDS